MDSQRLVDQRIRNYLINYLELAASFEEQQRYERDVPIAYVPGEVINMWEDNVWRDPRTDTEISSVYSPDEVEVMRSFHAVWDAVADALPKGYPTLAEVQAMPEWELLRRAAEAAHEVFAIRGYLPDDQEVP